MADEVIGWGFTELKLERRRPSKRQTTKRPFVIVKNWESSTDSNATPIKISSCSQDIAPSPQFPKQQWQSKRTANGNENRNVDNTVEDGLQEVEPHNSLSIAYDRTEYTSPVIDGTSNTTDSLATTSPAIDADHNKSSSPTISDLPNNGSIDDDNSVVCGSASVSVTSSKIEATKQQTSDASFSREHSKQRRRQQPSNKSHEEKEAQSFRKTRSRKRKQDDAIHDDLMGNQDIYTENRFVRIFNADQGRKVSVSEITDLDVILTAIEEQALQHRDEVESETEKQSIKEFFIQTRKSVGNCIGLQKELKEVKSDLRKAKIRLKKCRSELFEVQKKRTRVKGKVVKLQKEKTGKSANYQDLSEINNFVKQMKSIQRKCPMKTASSKETMSNLPSVMCQVQALLVSMKRLQALHTTFKGWLKTH